MPLRDVGEYFAWIDRESPSTAARQAAREFILELSERPWAAPSVPIPEVSSQPEYEVRTASLDVPGGELVSLWWVHVYATGDVDVVAVTLL